MNIASTLHQASDIEKQRAVSLSSHDELLGAIVYAGDILPAVIGSFELKLSKARFQDQYDEYNRLRGAIKIIDGKIGPFLRDTVYNLHLAVLDAAPPYSERGSQELQSRPDILAFLETEKDILNQIAVSKDDNLIRATLGFLSMLRVSCELPEPRISEEVKALILEQKAWATAHFAKESTLRKLESCCLLASLRDALGHMCKPKNCRQ